MRRASAEAGLLAEVNEAASAKVRELQTPPRVEAALLSAFRNQRRQAVLSRTMQWLSAGAAAAVLVFAFWTSWGRPKDMTSPAPRKDVATESKQPLDARAQSLSQADETQPAELVVASAGNDATYSMSDFVPVPFTDEIGPEIPGWSCAFS